MVTRYLRPLEILRRLLRGRLFLVVKILIATLLFGGLLILLNPLRLWNNLLQIEPLLVAIALLCGGAGVLVQWVKWQCLLRFYYAGITWGEGLNSLLIGFVFGLVSPGRLGELGRGLFLGRDRVALVGLAAVDRCSSVVVTLLIAWLGLLMLFPDRTLWLLGALSGSGLLVFIALKILRRKVKKWPYAARIWNVFQDIPLRLWGKVLGWSSVFNFIFFLQFYLLLNNRVALPLEGLWGIPLIFGLKAVLPLSFLDLGVREGAAVLVFSHIGIDPVPAFNAALLLFAINVFLPGLIGLALLQRNWSLGERELLSSAKEPAHFVLEGASNE